MTSEFGKLLRRLRKQAGLTQEQLAERSGVSVSTIGRLENGKPIDSRVGTVKLLADKLDLTPDMHRRLLEAYIATLSPQDIADTATEAAAEVSDSVSPPAPLPMPVTPVAPSPAWGALAEAANQLAQAVCNRWRAEEKQRKIQDPVPLPVRWQLADLTDRWDNIHRVPAGATAGPVDLAGDLSDIADVYRRIPSGRLVVLGRAGSGKTILALRFVLDYVGTPTSESDPVPVIFSIGSWNPRTTTLGDWLIERLVRDYPDYPGLAAATPGGSTLAAALVNAGRILPVLDGFDEIATGLHSAALDALNDTALPLLLTSRRGEYCEAVAATGVLRQAVGVELDDLTVTDLVNYLPRTTRRTTPDNGDGASATGWDPVLEQLRDHPDHPASAHLAAVLSTPLMIFLARTLYSDTPGQDPAILLDTTRFPTPHALEDHLLAGFVPTVYQHQPQSSTGHPRQRRNWDPERAQHWLGYLAQHVDHLGDRDGQDLAWWQLGDSLRHSSRILAVVLGSALLSAVSDWLVGFCLAQYFATSGFGALLLGGFLIGPVVGLGFGLVYGFMIVRGGVVFEPSRVQLRLLGRRARTGHQLVRTYMSRFAAGLLGGFAVGFGYGLVLTLGRGLFHGFPPLSVVIEVTLLNMLVFGLLFGLTTGLLFGLMAVLETPLDIGSAATPLSLLSTNRTTVVRQILLLVPMFALAIGFGGLLMADLLQSLLAPSLDPFKWPLSAGLDVGIVGGLCGVFSYALAFTAWGQWVLLSRVWLPLTGRLPWAMVTFLGDAYHRGVLRQAGAVYQFRHARLQGHLSHAFAAHRAGRAPISSGNPGDTAVSPPQSHSPRAAASSTDHGAV